MVEFGFLISNFCSDKASEGRKLVHEKKILHVFIDYYAAPKILECLKRFKRKYIR